MKPLVVLAAVSLAACATSNPRKTSLEEIPARAVEQRAEAAPAAATPAAEEPTAAPTEPLPCTLTRIQFAFDSTQLDAAARDALSQTAKCIAQKKIPEVVIEGHADDRGTEAYNIALGQRRAEGVRGFLQKLGVGAHVDAVSYGEAYPLERAENEQAWTANRRAELRSPGEKLSDGQRVVPGA
ncbi:MAG TPA: OmpA family protein [Anaeromyxobacteraceae bacterium]|nr:OmpA family protein [Anaeromyxobacteraceae bacterium]